jgi:cytochrome c biogenesis protein CcdA
MAAFDPSVQGIFIFGLVAGICPCNSVICIGLMGYLTSGDTSLSPRAVFRLACAFSLGTILVLLPLGAMAGYVGKYMLFLNESVAWSFGGLLLIAMGLQLLHVYKPPIRGIYHKLRMPKSFTAWGVFLIGLSFGAITVGRGAPMLIVVLTYIALYQGPVQGLATVLVYAIGLSIPLIAISTAGGTIGQKLKHAGKVSGDVADRIIGISILLIGCYFLVLAAS